ncbi:MAG: bifunctional folylpolyglutamate synthase/dihydrofolate synthase [Planctomycetota bacterium]
MKALTLADALTRLDARIDWEKRDRSKGWRVDLDPVHDLVLRTGAPQRAYEICHVAGSKGKGSVASLIGAALARSGARVGVYGSPHVERMHERIRIDGLPIDDDELARVLTLALDAVDEAQREGTAGGRASWFDIVTVAALCAFRDAGVNWAVLEVGLGGRLDSTNVIDAPVAAIVTTIALEHTAILGDTHAAIATEKAGIVKHGTTLVTGCDPESEAGRTLVQIAEERGVPIRFAHDPDDATFEQANARVARAALDVITGSHARIGAHLLDDEAIRLARLPGRMETFDCGGVAAVIDGAHVPESLERALAEATRDHAGPSAAVIAIHREKDPDALLAPLLRAGVTRLFATTIPESGVHWSETEVAAAASRLGIPVEVSENPAEALRSALAWARAEPGPPARWLLLTGSLYLAGAVRPLLRDASAG